MQTDFQPRYDAPFKSPLLILCITVSSICILALVLQPIAYRLHWWDFAVVTLLMQIIALFSFASLILLAVIIQRSIKRQHISRTIVAATLLPIVLLPLGIPMSQALRAWAHPFIHDISTDLSTPPTFEYAQQQRNAALNSLLYDPDVAAQQREHYPDIDSLFLTLSPQQAFTSALATVQAQQWQVTYQAEAQGHIEALDTSPLFNFKDDIVIRIRPAPGGGSQVDIRSVSQIGKSDLGTNAERVRQFLRAMVSRSN